MVDKSKVVSLPTRRKLEAEAAQWFVRLDRGDLDPAEQAEFDSWYASSAGAREAFSSMEELWQKDLGQLTSDLPGVQAANDTLHEDPAAGTKRTGYFLQGAIAASLVAAVALGTFLAQRQPDQSQATYLTSASEQQRVALPDGSEVILNTSSRIATRFDQNARRIELASGEAHFIVAKDAARPFIVTTPSGTATAVGTEFSVRVNAAAVDVLVTEGRVAVAASQRDGSSGSEPDRVQLVAGQSVTMPIQAATIAVKSLSAQSLEREIDWQDGTLSFRGEPLQEVVDSIERHSDLQIEIEGESLKSEPIVASYKIGEVEPLLEALDVAAGIDSRWIGANRVRIFRRAELQAAD